MVERSALVEPEIHEYRKRARNGSTRTVRKRIRRDVAYGELLVSGRITIKNASGTWRTTQAGEAVIALQLLIRLFDTYQDTVTCWLTGYTKEQLCEQMEAGVSYAVFLPRLHR